MPAEIPSRRHTLATLLAGPIIVWGCHGPADERPGGGPQQIFVDASATSGLDFVHFNGMTGDLHMPEMMGPGAALTDYDGDGDLDLFIVQGNLVDPDTAFADAFVPPATGRLPLRDRLFRNDLSIDGVRFVDVTDAAGELSTGYGMGVATGDYDNDGHVDLYVTNLGENCLLHNEGDGRFRDVTAPSGAADERWSVSAAFVDFDRDGWLDLLVGNYIDYDVRHSKVCVSPWGSTDYCGPKAYPPTPNRLLRNRGDGTFERVTGRAGLAGVAGATLGVLITDVDGDAWPDIFVANDGMANELWINGRDGTFRNEALLRGVAVNMDGQAEASMGVDSGDIDGDGDEDLFMTHLRRESNTLYRNDGNGFFRDASVATGLASVSLDYTGFGVGFLDYDNDGHLDVLAVNGAVRTIEELARAGDPFPLHQPNQLFHNTGGGFFEDVTHLATALTESRVSRGAVFGDVDNDGDTDTIILNNNGPARLLINRAPESGPQHHWLGLELVGAAGRSTPGTHVVVTRTAGTQSRRVRLDGSYASGHDPRVLFGLGLDATVDDVRVRWADGVVEHWGPLAADRYHRLRQGAGEVDD